MMKVVRLSPILALLTLGVLSSIIGSKEVSAHFINGNHWAHDPVIYRNILTNYSSELDNADFYWNADANKPDICIESKCPQAYDVQVADNDYGNTNWAGRCSPGTDGVWWSGTQFIDLNDFYMLGFSFFKRRAVITHEIGHCMGGLDHHNFLDTNDQRIMDFCVCNFYDTWGYSKLFDEADKGSIAELAQLWP